MRRIWEPCSFVGEKGVCTVCFPTLYIFVYPHLQIAVSVDAPRLSVPGYEYDRRCQGGLRLNFQLSAEPSRLKTVGCLTV